MERSFGEKVSKFSDVFGDSNADESADTRGILEWVRNNEIGHEELIDTPFGKRRVCYCDYTASGRALSDIEDYIQSQVLPYYGNTHSSVTVTAEQSTLFLHEARDTIRNSVGASEHDAVLFTGNGTTCAVELLVHLLAIDSPVVISGIQEHHSNILPWRQIASQSHIVSESSDGRVDLVHLEATLNKIRKSKGWDTPVVGCFSAASNITGICENIEQVTAILKKWNCISLWDYATAAPYIDINMNGSAPKDALYFSGHKFIGGVQTPGVLIVKKKLIKNMRPKRIGGGTVFFVSQTSERYLKEVEYREEGGTPDTVGAVRLALAFKLKATIGTELIKQRETAICRHVIKRLSTNNRVILLGANVVESRLAVFSFVIKDELSGLFLHHNLVSALLNDLFGIQSRSGCACAGPYAQHLLGIDEQLALQYSECLAEDSRLDRVHLRRNGEYSRTEMLRPGFTRISIPFFASHQMVEDILKAVEFVADNATKFITQYQLNCESGEWHHHRQRVFHSRKWLGFVSFTGHGMKVRETNKQHNEDNSEVSPDQYIGVAQRLAEQALASKIKVPDGRSVLDEQMAKLRWFVMGSEVNELTAGITPNFPKLPFKPKQYPDIESGQLKAISPDKYPQLEDQIERLSPLPGKEKIVDDKGDISDGSSDGLIDPEIMEDNMDINGRDHTQEEHQMQSLEESEIIKDEPTVCPLKDTLNEEVCDECPNDEVLDECSPACCLPIKEDEQKDTEDDWNRRVVVKQSDDITKQEEQLQPWVVPPLDMYRRVKEAMHSMNMIQDGDRVLVCLSGGKDSLSLLHVLHHYQQRVILRRKKSFRLGAITVDPGSVNYNPRPLIEYCKSLNIDYFYEEQDIIEQASRLTKCRSICAFCSRMKRGRLVAAAKLHGYNVLAMGHHLDDLAESFLMAAFQNGNLSTIKAVYVTRDECLRVIRPLIYVREKALREFAESNRLPIIAENCPACFEQPKERYRMKQLLASHELIFPQLFSSLRSALHPLLLIDSPDTSVMRKLAVENIVKEVRDREQLTEENSGDAAR